MDLPSAVVAASRLRCLAAYEAAEAPGSAVSEGTTAATRRGRRPATKRAGASRGSGNDTKAVREWAKANGYKVGDRGRIPAEVIAEYRSASV